MNIIKAFDKIIGKYGIEIQLMKLQEELSELNEVIYYIIEKYTEYDELDDDDIDRLIDELADVENLLMQVKHIYKLEDAVNERIRYKIDRTLKRINDDRE